MKHQEDHSNTNWRIKQWGQGKLPCIFIGPASIYFPTLPQSLRDSISVYGIDSYWATTQPHPSEMKINQPTLPLGLYEIDRLRQPLQLGTVKTSTGGINAFF